LGQPLKGHDGREQGGDLCHRFDIIRARAERLGEVDAPDEQAAVRRAAEVFDIPPERQNRMRLQVRQGSASTAPILSRKI